MNPVIKKYCPECGFSVTKKSCGKKHSERLKEYMELLKLVEAKS